MRKPAPYMLAPNNTKVGVFTLPKLREDLAKIKLLNQTSFFVILDRYAKPSSGVAFEPG